jgi:hypothetical protein
MRKGFYFIVCALLTSTMFFSSCNHGRVYETGAVLCREFVIVNSRGDSCEYVKSGYGLSHMGSCKYCKARRTAEKKAYVDEIDSILTLAFD